MATEKCMRRGSTEIVHGNVLRSCVPSQGFQEMASPTEVCSERGVQERRKDSRGARERTDVSGLWVVWNHVTTENGAEALHMRGVRPSCSPRGSRTSSFTRAKHTKGWKHEPSFLAGVKDWSNLQFQFPSIGTQAAQLSGTSFHRHREGPQEREQPLALAL